MHAPRLLVLLVLLLASTAAHAHGSGTRIATEIDLATGSVATLASPPTPASAQPRPPTHWVADVQRGRISIRDAKGAERVVANVHPHSWLTWQIEMGGILVFATRTFDTGAPNDIGHDVVRAVDPAGAVAWELAEKVQIPLVFEVDGALAFAQRGRLRLVNPATGLQRCALALQDQYEWPATLVPVDSTLVVFKTSSRTYGVDPRACASRWSTPSEARGTLLLHRGRLYDAVVSPRHTYGPVPAIATVIERDVQTGVQLRTFAVAAYTGFFDEADVRIVANANGNTLDVVSSFITFE